MPKHRGMMGGPTTHLSSGNVTDVECHKQVRTWRLLRAVMELLIPTCNCTFVQEQQQNKSNNKKSTNSKPSSIQTSSSFSSSSSLSSSLSLSSSSTSTFLTGTIFGYKKGKVKFCIQSNSSTSSSSSNPILLLELAVSTTILAREMRGGLLRIALECSSTTNSSSSSSLLEMPVWRMYCNGRRVGFAVRRNPSNTDMEVLRKMKSVVVGAGIVHGKEIGCEDDDIIYLRGNFERVRGSSDAESFHLIDPDGNINQDLSIFFLRS